MLASLIYRLRHHDLDFIGMELLFPEVQDFLAGYCCIFWDHSDLLLQKFLDECLLRVHLMLDDWRFCPD